MNEFELIRQWTAGLRQTPAVVVGPGDDCAVVDLGLADRWLLFKTDAVVAGVHFTAETAPERIGHKALARCLSDLAAMGGTPVCALVTLGLPRQFDPAWMRRVYDGMQALAGRWAMAISGGETTANPDRLLLSVAVLGTVDKTHCVRRAGARPGDALFVTGELGGSLQGKHLAFEPRLAEGRWLATREGVHAMIDLSDGLAGDLRHLLAASQVGAELLARAIPISPAARAAARHPGAKTPLLAALTDGEDFELLFAVAKNEAVPLLDAWKQHFPQLPLSCIGRLTAEPGLKLRHADRTEDLAVHGYLHFS